MTRDSLLDQMAGNYRLVAKLGAGGMGEVYKAVHEQIGSKVAIKVLHATQEDPSAEQRFMLEAKAVNRIEHPGVVKVIDAGRLANGRPFLVMELLDGASLHELRKAGKLTMPDACHAMVAALDAIAAAHAAGVVHRDLKPPNIFRTRDGRTVVLDFGIAKLMASDANVQLTMTGSAVGTPHYMSPEQIRGLPITPAVDIYAAGVVLFELLCNRRPFEANDDASVFAAVLENRPPPPRALEPSIPVEVQNVILTALAKDPAKRFASAAAMRDALRAALAIDPEVAVTIPRARAPIEAATVVDRPAPKAELPTVGDRPAVKPKPAKRPAPKRNRAIWFATGAVVLASAAIAIAVVASRSKTNPEPVSQIEPVDATIFPPTTADAETDENAFDDLFADAGPDGATGVRDLAAVMKRVEDAIVYSKQNGQLDQLPPLYFSGASVACTMRDKAKVQHYFDLMTDEKDRSLVVRMCADHGIALEAPKPVAKPKPRVDPFAADGYGTMVINSSPSNATVYFGNQIVGETPLTMRVREGDHKIIVMLDGYAIHTQTVHVDANGTARVTATLTKI